MRKEIFITVQVAYIYPSSDFGSLSAILAPCGHPLLSLVIGALSENQTQMVC